MLSQETRKSRVLASKRSTSLLRGLQGKPPKMTVNADTVSYNPWTSIGGIGENSFGITTYSLDNKGQCTCSVRYFGLRKQSEVSILSPDSVRNMAFKCFLHREIMNSHILINASNQCQRMRLTYNGSSRLPEQLV